MKPATTAEVQALLTSFIDAAALGTALESGLFWQLARQPQTATAVALGLKIPQRRCRYWLDLLVTLGLLTCDGETYALTDTARTAILAAYSREAWAHLAREWRERFPVVQNLADQIGRPGSVWEAQGLELPDYFAQIAQDLGRARHFTRMLYELHRPLAGELAAVLDLSAAARVLDLGGGSGVMALALLTRNPRLTAVVVDVETVCRAGQEIARNHPAVGRITYQPLNFTRQDLPTGFDLVLECDIGIYHDRFLTKLGQSLKAGGRLVIVDQFAPAPSIAPPAPPYPHWAFLGSLANPDFTFPTLAELKTRLSWTGFHLLAEHRLDGGWQVIEAAWEGIKP